MGDDEEIISNENEDETVETEQEEETIDSPIAVTLEDEIMEDLKAELSADPTFNENLLLSKVRNALREVKRARRYPTYYTEKQIEQDMYDYFSNIRNIALHDYNKIGGEYEESHSENSISRSFVDKNSLFGGIIPLSRF